MTESSNSKKIVIQDFNDLKSYLIENCIFFCDIILLLLICSYIQYIGIDNINVIDLILPLLIRAAYSFELYKFNKSDKQDGVNNTENINNFIVIKIIAFGMYMQFMFSNKINDKGVINDIVGSFIFCFTILVIFIFLIKTIFEFLKGVKKDKIDELNKYLNIALLLSFSFFISSDNFNDIKNYIFSSTINNDTIQNIKDFNVYVTISFIFLVTYIRKENYMIFSYGKRINSMLVFATFIFISIHVCNNIEKNTIDYGLLSYSIIIMTLSILVVNFVIEYDISCKKKIFFISFKIFFIFYTSVKSFEIFPNFLMEIILLSIISTVGLKNVSISSKIIKIVKYIVGTIGLCLIYTIFKNYVNEIDGNKSEYVGMVICILICLGLPAKNHGKNKEFKIAIKSILKVFYFDYIHESIRIKNEKIRYKTYLNENKSIFYALIAASIFVVIVHYFIMLQLYIFNIIIPEWISEIFGFFTYIIHVNELTSSFLLLIGKLEFKLFFTLVICIILLLGMRIFFTNERVLLISSFSFEYRFYNYNELTITYDNNKCYLNCNKDKLYHIKDEKIKKYLERKIKESLIDKDFEKN